MQECHAQQLHLLACGHRRVHFPLRPRLSPGHQALLLLVLPVLEHLLLSHHQFPDRALPLLTASTSQYAFVRLGVLIRASNHPSSQWMAQPSHAKSETSPLANSPTTMCSPEASPKCTRPSAGLSWNMHSKG